MSRYLSHLEKDVPHWVEQGWVTKNGGENILKDVAGRTSRVSFANVLGVMGALLLCFGVITFVAANWAEFSKLTRLTLLFCSLWATHGLSVFLKYRQYPVLAEAALLVGIGIFGASIMLVSQTYHIDGHAPDAVWMWALGALATSLLTRSRFAMAAFFVLLTIWSCWEMSFRFSSQTIDVHWQFLPFWSVAIFWTWRERWRLGCHLGVISFMAWLFVAIAIYVDANGLTATSGILLGYEIGLVIAALGCAFTGFSSHNVNDFSKPLIAYGFAALLFFAFALQFSHELAPHAVRNARFLEAIAASILAFGLFAVAWRHKSLRSIDTVASGFAIALPVVVFAALGVKEIAFFDFIIAGFVIALTIWAIRFGWRQQIRAVTIFGYVAFAAQLLYIYFETFGSLLDTAIFYFSAGGLLIAMAVLFMRLERTSSIASEVK